MLNQRSIILGDQRHPYSKRPLYRRLINYLASNDCLHNTQTYLTAKTTQAHQKHSRKLIKWRLVSPAERSWVRDLSSFAYVVLITGICQFLVLGLKGSHHLATTVTLTFRSAKTVGCARRSS